MKTISKYLGNFGLYQAYVYALFLVPLAISGAQTLIFSFTGAVPNARCRTPLDTLNSTYESGLNNKSGLQLGDERHQAGSDQFCSYCIGVNCTQHTCDMGFIYDTSPYHSTITTKYDLVCDSAWLRETTTSLFMVGVLVGATVFGMLADRFGRKTIFVFCCLTELVTFNVVYFIDSLPLYCFFHFINGAVQHGVYLTAFTMTMELMGGLPRVICGIWTHAYFTIGYIYVGIVAIFVKDWRTLQMFVAIPAVLCLPACWLVPESIRWLTIKGRTARAKSIFLNAAKWNGVVMDEAILDKELRPEDGQDHQETAFKLFSHWNLARTTLIIFFSWFVASMVYYGLSLNTSDLPGNVYVTYIVSGLIEMPGYTWCVPMMQYWGRRPSLVFCYVSAGICCILSGLIPHGDLSNDGEGPKKKKAGKKKAKSKKISKFNKEEGMAVPNSDDEEEEGEGVDYMSDSEDSAVQEIERKVFENEDMVDIVDETELRTLLSDEEEEENVVESLEKVCRCRSGRTGHEKKIKRTRK